MKPKIPLLVSFSCVVAAVVFHERIGIAFAMAERRVSRKSVADRLAEFGASARARMKPDFNKAVVGYPPPRIALVVLKEERRMEVYASTSNRMQFIRSYPVLAASGVLGPKLREGDRQVPEGIYAIESLNPNSAYHVSLRLNYPNEFDRAQARRDGRTALGGDIMIHGKSVSIGCVAIGDQAAEDVFTLAADTGLANVTVVCSPFDLRTRIAPGGTGSPAWTSDLYARIKSELALLPRPPR